MKILLDPGDQWLLDVYTWAIHKGHRTCYARAYVCCVNRKQTYMYLHHAIYGRPLHNLYVDHINNNGLDNRRANLRIVSNSTNVLNSRVSLNNTTGFLGVVKYKDKFKAQIKINRICYSLGIYNTPVEASEAYQTAKREALYERGYS